MGYKFDISDISINNDKIDQCKTICQMGNNFNWSFFFSGGVSLTINQQSGKLDTQVNILEAFWIVSYDNSGDNNENDKIYDNIG